MSPTVACGEVVLCFVCQEMETVAQKIARLEKELAERKARNGYSAARLREMIFDLRQEFVDGMDRSIPAPEAH